MKEILVYGADWCADCIRAKAFLKSKNVTYKYIDIEENPDVVAIIEKVNNGKRIIPTFFIGDDSYANPSFQQLTEILEL